MVQRNPKMPSPETSCSPKIKTTRKTNSPVAKPFYGFNDMMGALTPKPAKRSPSMSREDLKISSCAHATATAEQARN